MTTEKWTLIAVYACHLDNPRRIALYARLLQAMTPLLPDPLNFETAAPLPGELRKVYRWNRIIADIVECLWLTVYSTMIYRSHRIWLVSLYLTVSLVSNTTQNVICSRSF